MPIDPTRISLLILDPDRAFAPVFRHILQESGYRVAEVRTDERALESAGRNVPNIVIKPALSGHRSAGLMEELRRLCPDIQFIFVQEKADVRAAMQAMRRGAFDCLPLPCEPEQLIESVRRALENQWLVAEDARLLARLTPGRHPDILAGGSEAMRGVQEVIARVADTDVTVLIEGESGTGKELVARMLHERSRRSEGPFLAVNSAALPDSIIESELFGHVKGAFTGAIADKPGRFALASGGTLFLDEIGDLSPMGQADLLRVLEDGLYRPLGSRTTVHADARIVAATHRDLEAACRSGGFREDLLYRLNVITIRLPPLRERIEDMDALASNFVRHFCARHKRPLKRVAAETLHLMRRMPWPGNIRQLRNVVERMVLLTPARVLEPDHLPAHLLPAPIAATGGTDVFDGMTLRQLQLALVQRTVKRCGGNKTAAARQLGISRRSLHHWLAAAGKF